jgi:hypothetical protein
MKAFFKVFLFGLLLLGFFNIPAAAQSIQGIVPHEGTIHLQGVTRFDVYAEKVHQVIIDGHVMWLDCAADLIFLDKQHFTLNTTESVVLPDGSKMLYRIVSFEGKMSPAGELEFTWPETWWELGTGRGDVLGQMREHTGYELSGPGINKGTLNYVGYFDGNRLFADFHIVGFQVEPGIFPGYETVVDGPIKVNFSIDLNVGD